VSIDPLPVGADEDRPLAAFTDGEIDGSGSAGRQGDGHDFPAFAQDGERAVTTLQPEVPDVGADGLGHPQPVEGQTADQRVIPGPGQPRGDQHGTHLVAVQASGVGFIVEAWRGTWADGELAMRPSCSA
jgi:hypothetical protein